MTIIYVQSQGRHHVNGARRQQPAANAGLHDQPDRCRAMLRGSLWLRMTEDSRATPAWPLHRAASHHQPVRALQVLHGLKRRCVRLSKGAAVPSGTPSGRRWVSYTTTRNPHHRYRNMQFNIYKRGDPAAGPPRTRSGRSQERSPAIYLGCWAADDLRVQVGGTRATLA